MPFSAWLLMGFFKSIPPETEEAALVDGYHPYGAFLRVALPLARPGIISVIVFSFTLTLHEFIYALVFITRYIAFLSQQSAAIFQHMGCLLPESDRLLGSRITLTTRDSAGIDRKIVADVTTTQGIGPVAGEFYVFDRDREVLRRLGDTRLMNDYLDRNGGVRVYRDGIRVYNYGERGDDWLGLDLRRVNRPTRRISRNIILGAVHLSLEASDGLRKKTNRAGFIENDACARLRQIVLGALGVLEAERQIDKERTRRITEQPSDALTAKIEKPISELRRALARKDAAEDFEPYVARIESDYRDMQETLLTAGMSGLNLAVVFHEVERGVRALNQVITKGGDVEEAARQVQGLMRILGGFSSLLRRDRKRLHSAAKLVDRARQFNLLRFRHHRVGFVCPLVDGDGAFDANFSFGLVLGALNNLIDNALYWMRVRWPESSDDGETSKRRVFVGTCHDFAGGPAIVVADTGPGFQGDSPEHLVRPFFTRKPDGMGLGLYYANLAMELNGGRLAFPQRGEVNVPQEFDGAAVAMIFKAGSKCRIHRES